MGKLKYRASGAVVKANFPGFTAENTDGKVVFPPQRERSFPVPFGKTLSGAFGVKLPSQPGKPLAVRERKIPAPVAAGAGFYALSPGRGPER
jgi:hypothetical protein